MHFLYEYFKKNLTTPKIKDLISKPKKEYENIYNIIKDNSKPYLVNEQSDSNITENTQYPFKKINSKYLFIDFNSIVHVLSAHQLNLYKLNNKTNINNFEDELIDNIDNYLIEMFKLNLYPENLEYIYICIDGVPTMGKIYEQKKNAFLKTQF